jgi:hypothetical protein
VGGILEMMTAILKLILGIVLFTIAIVAGPLAGIWSLNTLFPALAIPYTWQTWLAFLLLFGGATGLKYKK